MRMHSWLTSLYRRLSSPTIRIGVRRPRGRSLADTAIVERLEPRQLLSAGAAAVGFETRVNTFTTGDQTAPAVAMDAAGDYVAVWQSYGQDGSIFGIYARRYSGAAALATSGSKITSAGSSSAALITCAIALITCAIA